MQLIGRPTSASSKDRRRLPALASVKINIINEETAFEGAVCCRLKVNSNCLADEFAHIETSKHPSASGAPIGHDLNLSERGAIDIPDAHVKEVIVIRSRCLLGILNRLDTGRVTLEHSR